MENGELDFAGTVPKAWRALLAHREAAPKHGFLDSVWQRDRVEEQLRIQIIIAGFVDDPKQIMLLGGRVAKRNVNLPLLQRRRVASTGGFLSGCIRDSLGLSHVMERIMTRKALGLAGVAAVLFAAPAVAHHAFAMFDQSKVLYMSGTVKQFEFVNPHAWLHVAIVNDKGNTATWSFEGGSPSQLVSLGWSQDHPRVGEMIEVGFRPMKDGSRGGQLMSVKFPSGQKVCSNRGCGDGTGEIVPGAYRPQ
jgi:hypothetical protein